MQKENYVKSKIKPSCFGIRVSKTVREKFYMWASLFSVNSQIKMLLIRPSSLSLLSSRQSILQIYLTESKIEKS